MRAELANLNNCAVPFLSRATANLRWYYYTSFTGSPNSRVACERSRALKDWIWLAGRTNLIGAIYKIDFYAHDKGFEGRLKLNEVDKSNVHESEKYQESCGETRHIQRDMDK